MDHTYTLALEDLEALEGLENAQELAQALAEDTAA